MNQGVNRAARSGTTLTFDHEPSPRRPRRNRRQLLCDWSVSLEKPTDIADLLRRMNVHPRMRTSSKTLRT